MDERDFEAQTSALAARPGALLLDYLRVRLPDDRATMTALQGWLGPMVNRGRGWRGWYSDSAMVLDGGLVAWCQDAKRREVWGVLVDLPGKACAGLGDRLVPFLRWCLDHSGHVTRADFAIDDREGVITYERVDKAIDEGRVVTRWQSVTEYKGRRGMIGWTFYFGSGQGDAMIRIYDKAGEQAKKHKGQAPLGHWVRVELEARGDFAHRLCCEYFDKGAGAVIGQITRRLRFLEFASDKWRAPAAAWWVAFIGSVQPGAALTVGELPVCTLAALAAFVERQAGPALATLVQGAGGDLAQVLGILDRSVCRLKPKHYAALALRGGAPC